MVSTLEEIFCLEHQQHSTNALDVLDGVRDLATRVQRSFAHREGQLAEEVRRHQEDNARLGDELVVLRRTIGEQDEALRIATASLEKKMEECCAMQQRIDAVQQREVALIESTRVDIDHLSAKVEVLTRRLLDEEKRNSYLHERCADKERQNTLLRGMMRSFSAAQSPSPRGKLASIEQVSPGLSPSLENRGYVAE
jgi:chromosome segregation ATPase